MSKKSDSIVMKTESTQSMSSLNLEKRSMGKQHTPSPMGKKWTWDEYKQKRHVELPPVPIKKKVVKKKKRESTPNSLLQLSEKVSMIREKSFVSTETTVVEKTVKNYEYERIEINKTYDEVEEYTSKTPEKKPERNLDEFKKYLERSQAYLAECAIINKKTEKFIATELKKYPNLQKLRKSL